MQSFNTFKDMITKYFLYLFHLVDFCLPDFLFSKDKLQYPCSNNIMRFGVQTAGLTASNVCSGAQRMVELYLVIEVSFQSAVNCAGSKMKGAGRVKRTVNGGTEVKCYTFPQLGPLVSTIIIINKY